MGNEFSYGLLHVKAECLYIERFINLSCYRGAKLRCIKRNSFTSVEFDISSSDYSKLKSAARITGAKINIKRKSGLYFLRFKIKRRKLFAAGMIIFFGAITLLSQLVWGIDVTGCKNIKESSVIQMMKKAGVHTGVLLPMINERETENFLLSNIKEISMVKIYPEGVRLKVEIIERTMPPEMASGAAPCDIIAAKDGIIDSLLIYKGNPIVSQNELVQKGQVLVSGRIKKEQELDPEKEKDKDIKTDINEKADNKEILIHAAGIVNARTWYEGRHRIITAHTESKYTGNTANRIYISIGGRDYVVKNSNKNFLYYDKIEESIQTNLFFLKKGFKIKKVLYKEKTLNIIKYTRKEAEKSAEDLCLQDIKKSLPDGAEMLQRRKLIINEGGNQVMIVTCIVRENIAKYRYINENGGNTVGTGKQN